MIVSEMVPAMSGAELVPPLLDVGSVESLPDVELGFVGDPLLDVGSVESLLDVGSEVSLLEVGFVPLAVGLEPTLLVELVSGILVV